MPAHRNQSHDHDHFNANLVFVEIDFQCLDKFQSQYNDEHTPERSLHHGVEIFRVADVGPGLRESLDEKYEKLSRSHRDCDDQEKLQQCNDQCFELPDKTIGKR
jgi:hypothetical protein